MPPQLVTKICSLCKRTLPIEEFYKRTGRPSRRSECKVCIYKQHKKWRAANPEKVKAAGFKWRRNNPRKVKSHQLEQDHGITLQLYETVAKCQGFGCAVCGRPEEDIHNLTRKPKRLAVDHDHTSGAFRGLLCAKCNRGLGMFLDCPELLEQAAAYLRACATAKPAVPYNDLNRGDDTSMAVFKQ